MSAQARQREQQQAEKKSKKFVSFIQQFIKRIIDPNGRRMANEREEKLAQRKET